MMQRTTKATAKAKAGPPRKATERKAGPARNATDAKVAPARGAVEGKAGTARKAIEGKTGAARKAVLGKAGAAGRAIAGKAGTARKADTDEASRAPRKAVPSPSPVGKAGPSRGVPGAVERMQEQLQLLKVDKADLQEVVRRLRAERDSALAEAEKLQDRARALEQEQSRRSAAEPQKAGPGSFDPTVDLEDDASAAAEDDLEGAAGFFDRMDEIRARRIELDRERNDRELEQSDQPYWMICPKCGDLMEEQESESIKLERCDTCGGLYLDRGEVDLLLSLTSDRDGQRRLHNALKF